MSDHGRPVRVGVLGCGVVGTQVVLGLLDLADDLRARIGAPLDLVGVAVLDTDREFDPGVPRELLTTDSEELVTRADVVIELIGGIEPARSLVLRAIEHGAAVVTANKALLAAHGPELYAAADAAGVDLFFEGAVGGAIPIIRPLRESLAGDRVRRVLGIVNGTTNYILDQMARTGRDQSDLIAQAQRLGYAEADPTADLEGHDAGAKAAILASLAFHSRVGIGDVTREGIAGVTAEDVAWATETGYVVKLLAVAERVGDAVAVHVHPALVPGDHPLATVNGPFNAVFVETERAGSLMFYGQGAGGWATSSAVLGDLVSAARHRTHGGKGPDESVYAALPVVSMDSVRTRYQIRLDVADRPGVLAQVSQVVARHGVSIETVRQAARSVNGTGSAGPTASLVVVTHEAPEGALATTVADLAELEAVAEVVSVLRVIGA